MEEKNGQGNESKSNGSKNTSVRQKVITPQEFMKNPQIVKEMMQSVSFLMPFFQFIKSVCTSIWPKEYSIIVQFQGQRQEGSGDYLLGPMNFSLESVRAIPDAPENKNPQEKKEGDPNGKPGINGTPPQA